MNPADYYFSEGLKPSTSWNAAFSQQRRIVYLSDPTKKRAVNIWAARWPSCPSAPNGGSEPCGATGRTRRCPWWSMSGSCGWSWTWILAPLWSQKIRRWDQWFCSSFFFGAENVENGWRCGGWWWWWQGIHRKNTCVIWAEKAGRSPQGGCPSSLAKLVYKCNNYMVYIANISIVDGTITHNWEGAPPCSWDHCLWCSSPHQAGPSLREFRGPGAAEIFRPAAGATCPGTVAGAAALHGGSGPSTVECRRSKKCRGGYGSNGCELGGT